MQDIEKKYPKLFDKDHFSPYSQRGIECGDGWLPIIDLQCALIQHHYDNPHWVLKKSAWIIKLYNKIIWNHAFYPIFVRCFSHELYCKLQKYLMADPTFIKPKEIQQPKIAQVKEKFGNLRIYCDGEDEYIRGVISMGEALSRSICENCGTNENVSKNKNGWVTTLCKSCRGIK